MIVREWLFLTIAACDAAEPWQLGFQDAATPMMQGIIDLHHDIFFFLILILVFVLRILVRALWHFHYQKNIYLLIVFLPLLGSGVADSSSSSESLNTFRHLYAADYEQSIFARIQSLENGQYYNIPPQTRPGEYASIVREHFDQAISVDHLRSALDMEYNEVLIWEKKAILQERLFSFMISEERIDRILQLSPYENIRKEAFEFLEGEVEGLNDLRSEETKTFVAYMDYHFRNFFALTEAIPFFDLMMAFLILSVFQIVNERTELPMLMEQDKFSDDMDPQEMSENLQLLRGRTLFPLGGRDLLPF
ncbi:hypothetical protein V6N11_013999 [Hibiscus sabdariffa]|uniref:Cytochrome oxidase subunit II transmembrane region profile domain-containing protein n=2 Tax=Hibiscus sabdariffa TaxID=183260 RepID=A0ABR2AFQ9_9ROSI